MIVGFKEDIISQNKEETNFIELKQSKREQTRDYIVTYLLMGLKPPQVAKSMGLSRQYIYRYKQDAYILSYILPGQLSSIEIARILGITEITILDVLQRYKQFIIDYSYKHR